MSDYRGHKLAVNKKLKLTKTQQEVMCQMATGAVIGETAFKHSGMYELFVRKPNWFPVTCHHFEHPFEIRRLNKNTVFALLTVGLICEDSEITETMLPFSRDRWYGFASE